VAQRQKALSPIPADRIIAEGVAGLYDFLFLTAHPFCEKQLVFQQG
jgi:hypothetical protein